MVSKNVFVMVCGPAASGKSTLVNGLEKSLGAYIFQPYRSFINLAITKNIPSSEAFSLITRDEAENHFCGVCQNYDLVVGDQHLAIQPNKDSSIATGNIDSVVNDENYVSAIDYSLFNKLELNQIRTLLIYLKTSPELLFERARMRYDNVGMYIRNKNINDVKKEVEAEEYFFNELLKNVKIENYVIDTANKSEKEVLDNAIQRTRKFKG